MTALRVALRLGRVSNLPTVWSNLLAGWVLGGGDPLALPPGLMLAGSLVYGGGMMLNDACDRHWDARHRPDRPIPAGQVSAGAVFAGGFALLALGLALLAPLGRPALGGGAARVAAVLLYDLWHKGNPLAPWIMGLCRALLILTAGSAAGDAAAVAPAAVAVLAWTAGLTFAARQEHLNRLGSLWPLALLAVPPILLFTGSLLSGLAAGLLLGWAAGCLRHLRRDVGGGVGRLIAGFCLVDALALAGASPPAMLAALGCFALALLAQAKIPAS